MPVTTYVLNLEAFTEGVDRFTKHKVPEIVKREHKQIAQAILQGCVMGTPVDTGNARGGWDVVPRASAALSGRGPDKSGAETVGEGTHRIQSILGSRLTAYTVLYIQNNVHYIGVLENTPHSPQNTGWVKATIASVQAGLRGRIFDRGTSSWIG